VAFSLLVSVFVVTFVYQPVRVEGTSMLPRLEDQDRLFINKFAYHFEKIERRSLTEMVIPPSEYFVMGDHRSISSDSRDFGPVPRNLIYGRASFVYWPAADAGEVH
jgi:signal peptidase I